MHTRQRILELATTVRMLVIAVLLILLAAPAAFASPWPVNFIAGPNGAISGTVSQSVPDFGSTTPVTAVPNAGYHFVNWTGTGGFVTTTANPLIVSNVTTTMDITANFNVGPATVTLPDYSMPLLTPASQEATAWTNVVPNALAAYYTYVPYSNFDAENLGFPPACGNPNLPGAMQNDLDSTEDCYTITVKKFPQQLALPGIFGGGSGLLNPATGLPFGAVTQVYGYGSGGVSWTPPGGLDIVTGNAPKPFVDGTFGTTGIWHFPAPTIRGTKGRPIRVQWLNELPNEAPVGFDPTVDCGPNAPDCYPYNRIVTHVHGAHVRDDSDGYAAAWFTPNFAAKGPGWLPSTYGPEGTYRYPMDQEAGTIWYHDHAMGTTHTNTQMGLAGFFPITDANEQALVAANILPTGAYELGFALQDRMFDINGQFAMPDYPVYDLFSMTTNTITGCTFTTDDLPDPATCTRLDWMKAADGHLIPYVPGDPLLGNANNAGAPFPAASTTLEYFGNMPVVNGVTYGKYEVEPRVYRMRFIGGTDSRTWVMKLVSRSTGSVIPFWQIGSEQGFLNNPVSRDTMDLLPGERLDVLVDLTGIAPGTKIVMQNIGPDMPYAGPGDPGMIPSVDIPEIMEFNVVTLVGSDTITTPSAATNLRPVSGAIVPLVPTPGTPIRNVSLVEGTDQYGRTMPTIDGRGFMQMGVPITEVIRLNDTEEWNIINDTVDAHPIHLHLVAFQVVSRQTFTAFVPAVTDTMAGIFTQPQFTGTGPLLIPAAWEAGWKDTVDCPPGTVTTVRAKFDIAGSKYVWHCHILSHEEHDMMRPFMVVKPVTDILWRNAATGDNAVWNMTGTAMTGSAFLPPLADPNWKIVGTADFNANGMPDLLWRNNVTGDNAVWYMNGTTMTGSAFLPPLADSNWNIVGTVDFNADGTPDLLWRNNVTGENAVWYMNGATRTGSAFLPPLADSNWNIVGAADANADGTPDLFWRNSAGENAVWYMSGATMMGSAFLTPLYDPNWNIVGVGDFNADGTPDLFWRNSSGENAVWYMTGTTMTGSAFLTPLSDPNWRIVGLQ